MEVYYVNTHNKCKNYEDIVKGNDICDGIVHYYWNKIYFYMLYIHIDYDNNINDVHIIHNYD